jgi:hypothetical protein
MYYKNNYEKKFKIENNLVMNEEFYIIKDYIDMRIYEEYWYLD